VKAIRHLAMVSPEDSLLIMDDRLARRYALRKGLNIIGTVRLLDLSEQQGLIESTARCIQEMADAGYRISMDLLQKVRSDSRELNAGNWLEPAILNAERKPA
jgi:predicted nucleic acid-binding protein